MAEIVALDAPDAVSRAVEVLRNGGLVVAPTDTVYTVFTDAFQTTATRRLFAAKGRGTDLPLSLLIRNPRQVIGLASEVPEPAERLMAAYWPGPVSLVLPSQPDMPWVLGDTGGAIGLRMPADDLVLEIAADIGPLACSAANRRGSSVPVTAQEAVEQLSGAVDLAFDGGERGRFYSTVVDCTSGAAVVVREGAIPAEEIAEVASGSAGWGKRPAVGDTAPLPTSEDT